MEENKEEGKAKKLALRRIIKKKKPNFIRQDAHKKSKLGTKWRRPKGRQSKIRLGVKGKRKGVQIGYGSPKKVKGLSREGFVIVNVNNVNKLAGLDPKIHGVMISSTVGKKKKIIMIEEVKKLSLKILNVKDGDSWVAKVKEGIAKRKAKRDKKKIDKEDKKKKAVVKKGKEDKNKEVELSEEEKKEQKKKEKDEVLIHSEH